MIVLYPYDVRLMLKDFAPNTPGLLGVAQGPQTPEVRNSQCVSTNPPLESPASGPDISTSNNNSHRKIKIPLSKESQLYMFTAVDIWKWLKLCLTHFHTSIDALCADINNNPA